MNKAKMAGLKKLNPWEEIFSIHQSIIFHQKFNNHCFKTFLDSIPACRHIVGDMCSLHMPNTETYLTKPQLEAACAAKNANLPKITSQEEFDMLNVFRKAGNNDWRRVWVSLTTDNTR